MTDMRDTLDVYKWFHERVDAEGTAALLTVAHMLSEIDNQVHEQWMNDTDSAIAIAIERVARALEGSTE